MIVQLDGATCHVTLTDPEAGPVRRLLNTLPLSQALFVPSCWSGPVCEVDLSDVDYSMNDTSVFDLSCSLYPGMVSLRRDRKILEIGYGSGESRSATGVQYGLTIGRVDFESGGRDLLARLATSHDVGALRGSILQSR